MTAGVASQRVVLATAFALDPKLIIMEEPTAALDFVVQREVLEEILDLKATLGFSILFITHDFALMAEFADRVGIMLDGTIVEMAATEELVVRPNPSLSAPSLHKTSALGITTKMSIVLSPYLNRFV